MNISSDNWPDWSSIDPQYKCICVNICVIYFYLYFWYSNTFNIRYFKTLIIIDKGDFKVKFQHILLTWELILNIFKSRK